jgi:NitT/TauT family transport system ATP-binding protein
MNPPEPQARPAAPVAPNVWTTASRTRSLLLVESQNLVGGPTPLFQALSPREQSVVLSYGMKQRVGIVRALATGPKVLLLDEPFGALDAQTRVIMQQILSNRWQRLKISVLFVTHDIDESIFLSDRVYCMTARPGTIKAEIVIPLGRPRHQSMMMSSEFLALRRGLVSLIREESLKAMGGEINDVALQGLGIRMHGESLADAL